MTDDSATGRVAIVGGGLAGLAAAVALCDSPLDVHLFEARKQLGGRAGSYRDETTGQQVDHCQHVSMGCCTNFAEFSRRTGLGALFRRDRRLYFFGPRGRPIPLRASPLFPAPFHFGPALLRMRYLSLRERVNIGRAMWRLGRAKVTRRLQQQSIGQWLRENRQSERAMQRFWSVLLVSALGESLDRASWVAARKVLVDGFMAHRRAYEIELPLVPLAELYDRQVAGWLRERDVTIALEQPVDSILTDAHRARGIRLSGGVSHDFDYIVVAADWRQLPRLVPDSLADQLIDARWRDEVSSSPITAVHLWFDRPITDLPHAVLVDRLSQWLFNHGRQSLPGQGDTTCHRYQVVISASRSLAGRGKLEIRDQVVGELAAIWPAASSAVLRDWRIITQRHAVFSYAPELDAIRPPAKTIVPNLFLAGDWTATGWPATMEGAVRSGFAAASQLLDVVGRRGAQVDDLRPSLLARWFLRCR